MKKKCKIVQKHILAWSKENPRDLPWKSSKDPYSIWVSEIILQQTRIAQGIPYYIRFLVAFPTIFDLAAAQEKELMKVWEGLGYYRRAKHMHQTAKTIVNRYQGVFPNDHERILELKGIGPYTAAAIASFAFDLPYPVVDGNVVRVISRIFGILEYVDSAQTLKKINKLASILLPKADPGRFNQAIMDFGAIQCKPASPNCIRCILNTSCLAFQQNKVTVIPQKKPSLPKRKRIFHYLHFTYKGDHFIRKRTQADIWENLFEFYLEESDKGVNREIIFEKLPFTWTIKRKSKTYDQTLSHQKIQAKFSEIETHTYPKALVHLGFIGVEKEKIRNFAFPKIIDWYLKDISL